ncbi:hypothetical protein FE810_13570 [Thalassotalea litorea]|uniref:Uncharacterized protein n=1 Tax=Thalassotalea litorea TaxID=2020715 RepID=A0A5R9IKH3_9GAMM|nr:hypothetical protein [Thalassotalea litorea]TLU61842.1 hypothetical protein FE810_13570 [Thalassotalea litorea]
MTEKVLLNIDAHGHDLTSNNAIRELILGHFHHHKKQLHEFMSRVCQLYDLRALVETESLSISDVKLDHNNGEVTVDYTWSTYYGCDGYSREKTMHERWPFKVKNNNIVFEMHMPELHVHHEL